MPLTVKLSLIQVTEESELGKEEGGKTIAAISPLYYSLSIV